MQSGPDPPPASALAQRILLEPRNIPALVQLIESDRAAVASRYEARIAELEAILLHVNNSLVGHGVLDVEHSIECHADTLPLVARALHEAIEKAHVPVNNWLHERIEKGGD